MKNQQRSYKKACRTQTIWIIYNSKKNVSFIGNDILIKRKKRVKIIFWIPKLKDFKSGPFCTRHDNFLLVFVPVSMQSIFLDSTRYAIQFDRLIENKYWGECGITNLKLQKELFICLSVSSIRCIMYIMYTWTSETNAFFDAKK